MADTDALLRAVLVIVVALLALPLVLMLVMVPFAGGMHGGTWGGGMWGWGPWETGMGWGTWLWMSVVPLVVLLVIAYGGYRLLRAGDRTGGDAAIEELRRAYARGELTDEEYESRRERLESDRDVRE